MIVHIDKLIRHLRSQIESADKVDSEFVYLTKREAEGCLELAEAQDVIQEMLKEQERLLRRTQKNRDKLCAEYSNLKHRFHEKTEIVRCKDCVYWQDNNSGYPHIGCKWREDETPDPDDFCSAGERRSE